jgi:hypothetical protein
VSSPAITDGRAPAACRRMAEAATRFLEALSTEQRAVAQFPFAGEERYVWNYTPVERLGLRLKEMTPAQRSAALALFDSGLSARGAHQARQIIALEPILREVERRAGVVETWHRDPERYSFSVFGEPGGAAPWGWRAGGHHIGIHFTIVGGDLVAPTPLFFGANPAEVRHGPETGLRVLAAEEDLARTLLGSLAPDQRTVAVVDPVAPRDILTKNYRRLDLDLPPTGIRYAVLTGEQREQLVRLVRHYIDRTADDLAGNAWERITRGGLEAVTFAWAGPEERGQGHYYAVKGPTFLIEYDNTQNDANHIHSVWRDAANDWGEDLLAAHYAAAHRQ